MNYRIKIKYLLGFYNYEVCNELNHVDFKHTRSFQTKMLSALVLKTALSCPESLQYLKKNIRD